MEEAHNAFVEALSEGERSELLAELLEAAGPSSAASPRGAGEAHAKLLRGLDRLPAMLAYWNKDERCVFANAAYETWFGLPSRASRLSWGRSSPKATCTQAPPARRG